MAEIAGVIRCKFCLPATQADGISSIPSQIDIDLTAVGSTGQRNGLLKGVCRRLEVTGFSGPSVEAKCELIKVVLRARK